MKKKSSSKITVKSKSDPTDLMMKAGIIIGVLFVVLIGAGFILGQNTGNSPSPGITYQHDDLVTMCIDHATISKHYHWKLEIFFDGEKYTIPANIGVGSNCMRPVHTHDTNGTVHVELPEGVENLRPTVGDFFEIWGQTLAQNELLGRQGVVTAKINGQTHDAASIADYVPSDGDTITLSLES